MDRSAKPAAPSSLDQMAEEIFALAVMSWRARVASKQRSTVELSESQYLALDVLVEATAGGDPVTVGEIQRSIGVLPAQMSRIVSSLQTGFEKPLIRCDLNQSDRRKIDVSMTSEGRAAYDGFRQSRIVKTVEMLKGLPDKDRQEFVRICRRIRELYRQPEHPMEAKPEDAE